MGGGVARGGNSDGGITNVSFGSSAPSVKLNGHGDGDGAGGGKSGGDGDVALLFLNRSSHMSICFVLYSLNPSVGGG